MTQKTRAALQADASSYLPDNTSAEISPEDVRQRVVDLADSFVSRNDYGDLAPLLDAIYDGGGATATDLGGSISAFAAMGGVATDVAGPAEHWAGTPGLYFATPQSLRSSEIIQTLVPSAGAVTIDGSAFFIAAATVTTNIDFATVSGLSGRRREAYITASGGTRTVTASGADVVSNIGAGVAIASGKTARFFFYLDASGNAVCEFAGSTDSLLSAGVPSASTTTAGIAELATVAETSAGTDATRTITPDGLAGSVFGVQSVEIEVFRPTEDVVTGDGAAYFVVPSPLNGMNLVRVFARVITAGTTGTTDVQVANVTDSVDMLSTKLTIDSTEVSSATAATPAVINASTDDVATNDLLRIDIDATSTTKAKGLIVVLEFQLP